MRRLGGLAALFALAGLSGCGFHPLYQTTGRVDAPGALGQIFVDTIPNRPGQLLRQALQERLDGAGSGARKRYELSVSYAIETDAISIQPDNSSTRNRLVGRVTWTLHSDNPQAPIVTSGFARSLDGNNVINEQFFYVDLAAGAAQARLAENLADQVTQQLATYFEQHPAAG